MRERRLNLHTPGEGFGLKDLDRAGFVGKIAYYESGPADATCVVVFIHGYALSAESFCDQVDYLRENHPDVRAVLLDLRGHGQSALAAPRDCNVDEAGNDVLAVLRERVPEGDIILVGHSLGGMVAQNVVRRCTTDEYARLRGVLLIATAQKRFAGAGVATLLESAAAHGVYNVATRLPTRVNRVRREIAEFVAPCFAVLVAGFPRMERVQFHVDMLLDTPLDSFVGFYDDLVSHSETTAAARLHGLRGIVMVGAADIVTPKKQSLQIVRGWPGVDLRVVPGAGHMVILEEPEAVSEALASLLS